MPDGSLSSDSSLIGSQAVEFFSSQFSSSGCVYNSELLQVIPSIITEDDNLKLCNIPDEKEILQAVKGLDPTSAPGPDGFTGCFYVHCWDILKGEVVAAVQDFFKGGLLPRSVTATTLILLPKVKKPTDPYETH